MVYCPKCGLKNQDDVSYCASCGANLNVRSEARPSEYNEICFGRGGSWGIVLGVLILVFGFVILLQQFYGIKIELWPLFVILIGVLIIVSAVRRRI